MARWRLTAPHYINVPGTEWEYKEIDQTTGRQGRKVFPVPRLLNPNDGADCNYPGEIIVAYAGPLAQGRDIIFEGGPTPDMEPLDEEAKVITESLRPTWQHPIETLPVNGGYSASLIASFEKQMSETLARAPNTSVSQSDFEKLQSQVAALMAQNAELQAKVKPEVRKV